MFEIKNYKPRGYQENIVKTALYHNTLIILPTGLGKTKTAILLAVKRLNEYSNTQVLFLTPTKPLAAQIIKEFQENTNIEEEYVQMLTGVISPKKRIDVFRQSKIIIATPQTIQKDLENSRISLEDVSLLVIDEAHRSKENYANTKVASFYSKQARNQRIIALTASPGGTKEKIDDVCKNLFIEKVEIREEQHKEVSKYVQKKEIKWIEVELPKEMKEIHKAIKEVYKSRLKDLTKLGFHKPMNVISKTDILKLQVQLRKEIENRNQIAFYGISLTSYLLKVDYLLELLETQGLEAVQKYWEKLKTESSKAAKALFNNKEIKDIMEKNNELIKKGMKHPKLGILRETAISELNSNPEAKIIIFANYRSTIEEILRYINDEGGIKAVKLIGQKSGLSQKEQIETIKSFAEGKYNVMVASQVGEEGLDICGANLAIMFDQGSSSEIRKIQRYGRVARLESGKIISLLTKDTREIGYYWAIKRKENTMRGILRKMQADKESQSILR
ncbi:DEAD/DEAH box helicase [Candidatus Woesearchaeota archaeon]|nr:DEAD/DEAH box helicase [Candidatus Woesearchaeota archaeon]